MIKVAIIEDDEELNMAISRVISAMPETVCSHSFQNAEKALATLSEPNEKVDVVIMDIKLPGMSGIECTSRLMQLPAPPQVLICTVYDDDDKLFESLKAGAIGYLLKSEILEKLPAAIRLLLEGGAPMSPGIARRVISFLQQPPKPAPQIELLTSREREILDWLGKGYRYKEIASELLLSIDTIRKHVCNIYQKLQVQSRTDALNKIYPK